MKRLSLKLLLAGAALTGLVSCNKDYNCVCYLNNAEISSSSVRAKTKNAAEDECNKRQSALGITHECKIEK